MATINYIDPQKSKKTGEIPFVIEGTGFITSDLSSDFSGSVFYSDASSNGGEIILTEKLSLSVDNTSGSTAGILTGHTFLRSFDVSAVFEYDVTTFPSIDGSKIISIQSVSLLDPGTYFEIYLGYKDSTGYFIKAEAFDAGIAVYSRGRSINASSISELKIIRAEEKTIGYMKIEDTYINIGEYLGLEIFESKIKIYSSNSAVPVSGSFKVDLLEYNVSHILSLCNQPASISTVSDERIEGRTQSNITGLGDLVLGLPDGTFTEEVNGFEYTAIQGANRDSKNFDVIISVFNFNIVPSRSELFSSAGSFTWDENYWIAPNKENKNLYIPSLWDPVTANVPADFIQSGHGDSENIKLLDIKKFKAESLESWHARINHGTYFIKNVPYYLHSSQSISNQLGISKTEDGRSTQHLHFLPKIGVPISASILTTDTESGLVIDSKRFKKRGKFTGRIQNGVELDTTYPANIDETKNEFIVHYNSNNMIKNWKVTTEGTEAGLYSFVLPSVPIKDYSVVFSRTDIFNEEKQSGSLYGATGTIYQKVLYGEPLEEVGDYSVNYITGEVNVILDQEYLDIGYVTFTFDYPAIVEFNSDYLKDKGSQITEPIPSDIGLLDTVGESDGTSGQTYRLKSFPVLDFSDSQFLDREIFQLFLYDESDSSFDTDWLRVRDILDHSPGSKVYQLNPDQGLITFGDGITGMVPQKYKKIVVGYQETVRIEYEPVSSIDYWTGKDTDLNLSRNSLSSGFLYLSRKELIPDTISLQFSTDLINALEFAELSAVVRDRDGDPVPGVELIFEIMKDEGNLEEESIVTNSNGEAKTTFIPSGSIADMGIFAHLYQEGTTPDLIGEPKTDVFYSSGLLLNNLLVAEEPLSDEPSDVYLFKIYDNGEADAFLPYNNQTRMGGTYLAYHSLDEESNRNELIRPSAINGKVLIFEESLPQSFSPAQPFYEPNLRGFAIIGKKRVQAKAKVDTGMFVIDSDIASLEVEYSEIQKGEWTLPVIPTEYTSSEIDRATYITINPEEEII